MRRKTLAFLVLACGLIAATLAGGIALVMVELRPPPANVPVEAFLGAVHLRFLPGFARLPEARRGGTLDRLDLAVTFPDFHPAKPRRPSEPEAALLFIRMMPPEATLDPADRPLRLYAPFLELAGWEQEGGLVMRRFVAGSPYQTDDLYLAPPEGRLFWARCLRPAQPPVPLPDTCLSDLRLHGLDVQVRFDPALLPQWERLVAGVRGLVEGMAR